MNTKPNGDPAPYDDEDDDSVEDVREILRVFDQELVEHGIIPAEEQVEPRVFTGYISPVIETRELVDAATEEASLEAGTEEFAEYVTSLRATLTSIGLADPGSVIPENVMDVGPEILEQLDSLNAEALFYDVARRVHKELGPQGQVTWGRLLERARPTNIDGTNDQATDLDKLRIGQSLDNTGDLGKLGIRLTVPPLPDKQQNINRLAYLYSEEPSLIRLKELLEKKAEQEEFYLTMEKAIKSAKRVLDLSIESMTDYRRALDEQVEEQHMDSIDQEVWAKHSRRNRAKLRRARASSNIIKIMVESMDIKAVDDLTEVINGENGLVSPQ